ncbi:MAG: class I SAM-dependent methyltransferase [Chloroflexi bacterium]|nr:class I SAM-dependent methyltransferase [Chloroflexota bacterium]
MARRLLTRSNWGRRVYRARDLEKADHVSPQSHLPGHYHSPIPDLRVVANDALRIFADPGPALGGIDLRDGEQFALLQSLVSYYGDLPFAAQPTAGLRYYYENGYYSYSDGICLYGLLRHLRPARIIEVGSGFTSSIILDTNERFLDRTLACTFIDPEPQRLLSLLRPQERDSTEVVARRVQDIAPHVFERLSANDILLIDSSHVAKIGSDVNYLLFEILPRLAGGVYIHFHDIYWPFEYPREWVTKGIAWNEAYTLRAFLQYNPAFEISFFSSYLRSRHPDFFRDAMPLCLKSESSSLWIRKL